jgi:hypothetical protein
MMQDGLYWLRLVAYDKTEEGVAVVRQGMVNGGGPNYVWQGRLASEDGAVRGNLLVRKWNTQMPPDLGMFKTANLGIEGILDDSARSLEIEGHAHGHHVVHLHISGHWLGELADDGQ